ncbi:MAG: DNA polymerase IV [Hungatella sp.]|nr:DNA polymerase IV [Hungatella sp.]
MRLIFHIDVNSAFLSWESVYRLTKDPSALDLRTIPSVVGGDQKTRHGVVLAKSTPARAFGVTTGEPIAQALKKCPSLTCVPSRFEVYQEYSDRLIHLLEEYTPTIEKFSIDEAFLDMTETIHLFGEPEEVAARIRERIKRELGFTVNIGLASNKLLAKMASDFQKPDLCHTLWDREIPSKLWPLPVRELFFVGGSAEKKLKALGIYTVFDLAHCDPAVLRSHLGVKYARQIHRYANGIDDDPVEEKEPAVKGYGNSITLSRDVDDYESAFPVLLSLCETVGSRLRRDHVTCCCVCVELKDWRFISSSHQTMLKTPTDSSTVLYEASCRLLRDFWDLTPVRLIGVRVTKISDEGFVQMSFFDSQRNRKLEQMERAVDAIRSRFGVDSIKRASFLAPDAVMDHSVHSKTLAGSSDKATPPSSPETS